MTRVFQKEYLFQCLCARELHLHHRRTQYFWHDCRHSVCVLFVYQSVESSRYHALSARATWLGVRRRSCLRRRLVVVRLIEKIRSLNLSSSRCTSSVYKSNCSRWCCSGNGFWPWNSRRLEVRNCNKTPMVLV